LVTNISKLFIKKQIFFIERFALLTTICLLIQLLLFYLIHAAYQKIPKLLNCIIKENFILDLKEFCLYLKNNLTSLFESFIKIFF